MSQPVKIFIAFSHKDEKLEAELKKALRPHHMESSQPSFFGDNLSENPKMPTFTLQLGRNVPDVK